MVQVLGCPEVCEVPVVIKDLYGETFSHLPPPKKMGDSQVNCNGNISSIRQTSLLPKYIPNNPLTPLTKIPMPAMVGMGGCSHSLAKFAPGPTECPKAYRHMKSY